MSARPRVAVIGAGGVGALIGGSLAQLPGVEVTFCVRRAFDRLVLVEGDESVAVDAAVAVTPDDMAPVDWVLLATKAHQTDGARSWLEALAGPAAPVVVLQNGVEHVERVRPLVGAAAVVPAVVRCGGEVLATGRVAWRVEGPVSVPATDEGRAFVALSEGSRVPTVVVDDWLSDAWRKLATNVASSAVGGALGVAAQRVGREPALRELATALLAECVAVGRAAGADIADGFADEVLDGFAALPDTVQSSTCQDRLRGLPLEHDALVGAVIRAGDRTGTPTPCCQRADAILRAVSGRPLGS